MPIGKSCCLGGIRIHFHASHSASEIISREMPQTFIIMAISYYLSITYLDLLHNREGGSTLAWSGKI